MNESTRAYIYRVSLAAIPLLIALGYLTDVIASHVALLAAALLGFGTDALATKHTSTDQDG